jgi:hypothetical protein
MKKLIAGASSAALFLSSVSFAFAQTKVDPCETGQFNALCGLNAEKFGPFVGVIINAVFVIAVIVALAYLIYGGIRWIMSQGDKSKVQDARNHIIAAVIGLIIVFLAYFIINIILGVFLGINISQLELPNLKGI